jgi:hypothetical protein
MFLGQAIYVLGPLQVATGEWFSLEDGGELRQHFIHDR